MWKFLKKYKNKNVILFDLSLTFFDHKITPLYFAIVKYPGSVYFEFGIFMLGYPPSRNLFYFEYQLWGEGCSANNLSISGLFCWEKFRKRWFFDHNKK